MLAARWLQVVESPQAVILQNASGRHLEQEMSAAMNWSR